MVYCMVVESVDSHRRREGGQPCSVSRGVLLQDEMAEVEERDWARGDERSATNGSAPFSMETIFDRERLGGQGTGRGKLQQHTGEAR